MAHYHLMLRDSYFSILNKNHIIYTKFQKIINCVFHIDIIKALRNLFLTLCYKYWVEKIKFIKYSTLKYTYSHNYSMPLLMNHKNIQCIINDITNTQAYRVYNKIHRNTESSHYTAIQRHDGTTIAFECPVRQ